MRAAELARTPRVYAATVSREYYLDLADLMRESVPDGVDAPDPEAMDLGVPEASITTRGRRRRRARPQAWPRWPRTRARSPATRSSSSIDDEAFRRAFGIEWFIRLDDGDAEAESGLL